MSGSDTASFTDPRFLALFGLSRVNVLEYFLHPLNPFRSQNPTPSCNELLGMQHISIQLLMQNGTGIRAGPLSLPQAEEEYNAALSRLTGEQYELLPPPPSLGPGNGNGSVNGAGGPLGDAETGQAPLYVIRHVLRKSPTVAPVLGVYYVLEGVIYKSPSLRTLMKSNIARTCKGLQDACDVLSSSSWYSTASGHFFDFEGTKRSLEEEEDEVEILERMRKKGKRARRVLDNRRPGERTEEEEEGLRSKEKMNSILLRLSKSSFVQDS